MSTEPIEILILHGRSLPVVEKLKTFLTSIGIKATTAMEIPAPQQSQWDKVRECIQYCRVPLVLATFNEAANTNHPWPNVISELARCLDHRPTETIILRETRNHPDQGTLEVDVGTNLASTFCCLPFQLDRLTELYVRLLPELVNRNIITVARDPAEWQVLQNFMKKMDHLWDDHFDVAGRLIERDDGVTRSKFYDSLDDFFLSYWRVFDHLVGAGQDPRSVQRMVASQYTEALSHAVQAWRDTGNALSARAEALLRKRNKATRARFQDKLEQCQKMLSDAKSDRRGDQDQRLQLYLKACKRLDSLIKRIKRTS